MGKNKESVIAAAVERAERYDMESGRPWHTSGLIINPIKRALALAWELGLTEVECSILREAIGAE